MTGLNSMKRIVDEHPLVHHPFLERFRNGDLTLEQVRGWARQQFFLSISLPDCFAALYARVPDRFWREKRALVELIKIEAWGADDPECHSLYFKEFLEYIGLRVEELTRDFKVEEFTSAYLKERLDICLGKRGEQVSSGLAAIALGNEYVNLSIYRAYREGIHKIPSLELCPTGYFDAHLRDEDEDFRVFANLYTLLEVGAEEEAVARAALFDLLNARVSYFDKMQGSV